MLSQKLDTSSCPSTTHIVADHFSKIPFTSGLEIYQTKMHTCHLYLSCTFSIHFNEYCVKIVFYKITPYQKITISLPACGRSSYILLKNFFKSPPSLLPPIWKNKFRTKQELTNFFLCFSFYIIKAPKK